MALPRKLKYLNLFNDGMSYMGQVHSVTLPKLTRKLENYRGGGMQGSAPVDFGLDNDALVMEWNMGGLPDSAFWSQYSLPGADAVPLRFAGSYQRDDTGDITAVEIVLRGRHKSIDSGESKQGEETDVRVSTQCTYYKLIIDGVDMIEIDTINMIEKVNGVDRLEQHRRNIGL
ncbi:MULTISPECIES: phage major tail tube protein [Dickeya]|jgi:P2 family phage contractile tail tube protein|uniref:Phage major tail tube protein n=2 Tax=Dickeya TaxID=204037 RepID=A0AAE7CYR5_9GAMM|nr:MULTISPECIES: phage major tail tube protein [Dickeya]PXW48158.1 hypothetical protein DFO54_102249 [Erwinia sp. AG740]MBP2836141.1 phage major tail tube protein [Dickeya parazeae]MBP2850721.1 phage major tail tube protein [Dickeya oryzae]MBP2858204.1 phage major tail tube protein [Dickeya oryzae]MCA6988948.1 phage major tail tube protein [Dickeya zeae]